MAEESISINSAPRHPNSFVGAEFLNSVRSNIKVCPKCSYRLVQGKNNEFMCVTHGPLKDMITRKQINPDPPIDMQALPPAPICPAVYMTPRGMVSCSASIFVVDGIVVCPACEKRREIEERKAQHAVAKVVIEEERGTDACMSQESTDALHVDNVQMTTEQLYDHIQVEALKKEKKKK